MADDLRFFLADRRQPRKLGPRAAACNDAAPPDAAAPALAAGPLGRGRGRDRRPRAEPLKIVPKGLRSFDADDADFFLELFPGPRDRDGLPESLRFWKTLIESTDAGPYIQRRADLRTIGLRQIVAGQGRAAAASVRRGDRRLCRGHRQETETRLLNGLRKRCPALPGRLDLKQTLAAVRRDSSSPGQKVLIVLDQFEQWLHAQEGRGKHRAGASPAAMRRRTRASDRHGARRFLDGRHALHAGDGNSSGRRAELRCRRSLRSAMPRRCWPLLAGPLANCRKTPTTHQGAATIPLSGRGGTGPGRKGDLRAARPVCRDAQRRPWTPATFKQVGGAAGVGVAFLEETFAPRRPPRSTAFIRRRPRRSSRRCFPRPAATSMAIAARGELLAASGYGTAPATLTT